MLTWGEKLGKPECPYLIRWVINFWLFSIRLHHWIASDDQRHFHDHPWWYLTFVICGQYKDISPNETILLKAPKIAFRRAKHRHTVETKGCWTIMLTGPETRIWGFWVNGRFRKRNKYFYQHGHHPCNLPQ